MGEGLELGCKEGVTLSSSSSITHICPKLVVLGEPKTQPQMLLVLQFAKGLQY